MSLLFIKSVKRAEKLKKKTKCLKYCWTPCKLTSADLSKLSDNNNQKIL